MQKKMIKKLLKTQSIRQLARELDVSDTTIQYWKKGTWCPTEINLNKIKELYERIKK